MHIMSLSNSFDIKHTQVICNNTDPEILGYYFHKQGWLTDTDFTLLYKQQGKNKYYKNIMTLIESLGVDQQGKLLFDFKIVNFFTNSNLLSQNKPLSKANKSNLKFLLHYLKETNNHNIEFLPHSNLFDQAVRILTDFNEEFYEAYSLYAHFEPDKTINTKTKNILDLQQILQRLIIDKKFTLPIKSGSNIQGFYIKNLTLVNLYADNSEISINTKHAWQDSEGDKALDIFCRLLEQYNIRNPMQYIIKKIEIIAIVNIPYIDKKFKKCFLVDHEGTTSLGFETIDKQIKECLKEYEVVKEFRFIFFYHFRLFFKVYFQELSIT